MRLLNDGNSALRFAVHLCGNDAAQFRLNVIYQRILQRHARIVPRGSVRVSEGIVRIAAGRRKVVGGNGIERFGVERLAAHGFNGHATAGLRRRIVRRIGVQFPLFKGNRRVDGKHNAGYLGECADRFGR